MFMGQNREAAHAVSLHLSKHENNYGVIQNCWTMLEHFSSAWMIHHL